MRSYGFTFGVIAAIFAVIYGIGLWYFNRARALALESTQSEGSVMAARAECQLAEQSAKPISNERARVGEWFQVWLPHVQSMNADQNTVMNALSRIVQRNNLAAETWEITKQDCIFNGHSIPCYKVTIGVSGDYAPIRNFLRQIEESYPLASVDFMILTRNSMTQRLDMKLTMPQFQFQQEGRR